jgi:hypothetical protein
MVENQDLPYTIGYKKPPRHAQFQPGQSGNPSGRPKKIRTSAEVLQKELMVKVPITVGGKRRKVSMLEAIWKQHTSKAAAGDPRAASMVFEELRFHKVDDGDNIRALVQEFRASHASCEAEDRNRQCEADVCQAIQTAEIADSFAFDSASRKLESDEPALEPEQSVETELSEGGSVCQA